MEVDMRTLLDAEGTSLGAPDELRIRTVQGLAEKGRAAWLRKPACLAEKARPVWLRKPAQQG